MLSISTRSPGRRVNDERRARKSITGLKKINDYLEKEEEDEEGEKEEKGKDKEEEAEDEDYN